MRPPAPPPQPATGQGEPANRSGCRVHQHQRHRRLGQTTPNPVRFVGLQGELEAWFTDRAACADHLRYLVTRLMDCTQLSRRWKKIRASASRQAAWNCHSRLRWSALGRRGALAIALCCLLASLKAMGSTAGPTWWLSDAPAPGTTHTPGPPRLPGIHGTNLAARQVNCTPDPICPDASASPDIRVCLRSRVPQLPVARHRAPWPAQERTSASNRRRSDGSPVREMLFTVKRMKPLRLDFAV